MRIRPAKPHFTVRQAVSRHLRKRSAVNRMHAYARSPWRLLIRPFERFAGFQERRALRALIQLQPNCLHEAEEKLVYLLALMAANAATISAKDVHCAIDTLRPFRSHLAEAFLQKATESSCIRQIPDRTLEPRPAEGRGVDRAYRTTRVARHRL